MKKVLFIDRDGTLITEPEDKQIDSLEKLSFLPGVFTYLGRVARSMPYEMVMVSNQDGLGTVSFPEDTFWPAHNKMMEALQNEGVRFSEILIDRSFDHENKPTRKPRTGLVESYLGGDYDLTHSFVIGDRTTDVELAGNMGCRAILLNSDPAIQQKAREIMDKGLYCCNSWEDVFAVLKSYNRVGRVERNTRETRISVTLNLEGKGNSEVDTGIGFFDHMLDQIAKHGQVDLEIKVEGDLHVDEHHTIEDTGIALGEAVKEAIGDKKGIARYGFCLPMDDALAQVALDLGGRPWFEWDATFNREMIGQMPTEMFPHFFKSFSDNALCNLNIKAEGDNEHHKIEAIFKAFARALRMAVRKDYESDDLPTTKGSL